MLKERVYSYSGQLREKMNDCTPKTNKVKNTQQFLILGQSVITDKRHVHGSFVNNSYKDKIL